MLATACALTLTLASAPAQADDYDATIKDIQSTMGGVPSFVKQFPKAGLPGAWAEVKAIELSDKTALPPKVKSLISLAVAAQIPGNYCI
ncbi:carboxymuconolactone decarboxylase family protein, partial [Mesorhizobium sp. M4B.F.Ca.ET.088.02.2.1]